MVKQLPGLRLKIFGRHESDVPEDEKPAHSVDKEAIKVQSKPPIVEGILPLDQLLKLEPQTETVESKLDIHLPVLKKERTAGEDACPFMDLNHSKCSQHFTLSHMESAFAICLCDHESCEIYQELILKFAQPIPFQSRPQLQRAQIDYPERKPAIKKTPASQCHRKTEVC